MDQSGGAAALRVDGAGPGPGDGPDPGPGPGSGSGPDPDPGFGSGSVSGSSHSTSDCVSAVGSPSPAPSPVPARSSAWKQMELCRPPEPGSSEDWPHPPTARERLLLIKNQVLKSTLIKTLEKLQTQMEDSRRVRRLLSRLMKLRSLPPHPSPAGTASTSQAMVPADLYSRYQALVKQNYQLEQALRQSGGQLPGAGHGELEEYKAVASMQMAAMQQDWRDEREEKERALALNAQLHQKVEQLRHQLEQLQLQQRQPPGQPLSEPFESLEPSGLTGSSSWGAESYVTPQPRRMLPPPGQIQTTRGLRPAPRPAQRLSRRSTSPARSVEEVLSTPYAAIRSARPVSPPSSRRPPVESDLRRPLPPPGRLPAPDPRRPLLARDSGYSDLLSGGQEDGDGDAQPLLSRVSVDTGTGEDWTPPEQSAGLDGEAAAAGSGTHWSSGEYEATNTAHQVTCPYCGAVFSEHQHLVYWNHLDECPARRRPLCPG